MVYIRSWVNWKSFGCAVPRLTLAHIHMFSLLAFQLSSGTTVTLNIRPGISPSTASFPTRHRTLRKRSPNFTKSTSKRDVSVKYFTVFKILRFNWDSQLNTHTEAYLKKQGSSLFVGLWDIVSLSLSGLTPAQSEFNYLNAARTLELYGVELHYARVSHGTLLPPCLPHLLLF